MSQLKEQANSECQTNKISTFQALSALVWRSLARARGFHAEQVTNCEICINDRKRLNPPLSDDYFGCYINIVTGKTKTWDLLSQNLGSAALTLHEAIADHTDETIRSWLHDWKKEPKIFQLGSHYNECSLIIGGSPKFNPYGCDFGWGKPLEVRSGWTSKFSGTVWMNPGQVGGGSVDLEICLSPEAMSALESDEEFMDAHHDKIM
ncbi:BAHD acyltransferase DCR-like [Papaver somniferum]|uniref:BAHD acyltransferase DCR-like n=1 Tax=Papaver somniferum TaxID=3469 RepID=UPI000E703E66|nr:BAHD acyltransferase DCR-like [Papaver somniferum]